MMQKSGGAKARLGFVVVARLFARACMGIWYSIGWQKAVAV
jgi:hypothetical protein